MAKIAIIILLVSTPPILLLSDPAILDCLTSSTNQNAAITVPDDFFTIQEAIDYAQNGDTIFVKKGTYSETLSIDKSLSLIGEDPCATIINGKSETLHPYPSGWVTISISAPNVRITGFNITNCEIAINLGASGVLVAGNNLENNKVGIDGGGSSVVVSDNNFTDNWISGIRLSSQDSMISNNRFYCNYYALWLTDCDNATVCNNQVIDNSHGLDLTSISNTSVFGNSITSTSSDSEFGILLTSNSNNTRIYNNNIWGNTQGIVAKDTHLIYGFQGSGNLVFNNNLFDNKQNAAVDDYGELAQSVSWDNGTSGNYWGDYLEKAPNATEVGTSGIGDTPYVILGDTIDRYPHLQPFSITVEEPGESVPTELGINTVFIVIAVLAALIVVTASVILIKRQKTG